MAQIMKQMLGMFAGEANESLTKIASGIPLGDKGHGSHKLDVRSTRRMSNSPTSRASAAKLLGNAGPDEMDTRISIQIWIHVYSASPDYLIFCFILQLLLKLIQSPSLGMSIEITLKRFLIYLFVGCSIRKEYCFQHEWLDSKEIIFPIIFMT